MRKQKRVRGRAAGVSGRRRKRLRGGGQNVSCVVLFDCLKERKSKKARVFID